MERRLAAVMIADVAGYSRLSNLDEEATRRRFLSDLAEVIQPSITKSHGRLVKTMGDGLLVEFPSVIEALHSAVDIQQAKAERQIGVSVEQRLNFRIGVNIGDVIVEGEDIHGDGVNIAARMQALADPGGIAISGTTYDQAKGKVPFHFLPLGEQRVKGIADPIRVYRVTTSKVGLISRSLQHKQFALLPAVASILTASAIAVLAWWGWGARTSPGLVAPSIVVLPFQTLSGNEEHGYLADGFSEDLTTALARIPGLFVVSRKAAFSYKNKTVDPLRVSEKLGVRYLLEGSVRKLGDNIRINAQLIDGHTAGHVWAERFDGQWSEVFALQDKVVERTADALKLRLVSSRGKADTAGGTSNPVAYDAYLRGSELEEQGTPGAIVEAESFYKQAIAVDPTFGLAAASLASLYWNADSTRAKALKLNWQEIDTKLREALRMAGHYPSPTYYQVTADLLVREHRSDDAVATLQRAIPLNPSDDWTYVALSDALSFNGKPRDARSYLGAAMRVDPGWTDWRYYQEALSEFGQGRYESAVAALEKIDSDGASPWPKFYGQHLLLSAYGHLGELEKAKAVKESLARMLGSTSDGPLTQLIAQQFFVYKNESDVLRLLEGLESAGVDPFVSRSDTKSWERLDGQAIERLFKGHTVAGSEITPNKHNFGLSVWQSGKFNAFFGNQGLSGTVWVQGDFLCLASSTQLTNCAAVLLNPRGSPSARNEYRAIFRWSELDFSVVN
jgi:adenylate cyclase